MNKRLKKLLKIAALIGQADALIYDDEKLKDWHSYMVRLTNEIQDEIYCETSQK